MTTRSNLQQDFKRSTDEVFQLGHSCLQAHDFLQRRGALGENIGSVRRLSLILAFDNTEYGIPMSFKRNYCLRWATDSRRLSRQSWAQGPTGDLWTNLSEKHYFENNNWVQRQSRPGARRSNNYTAKLASVYSVTQQRSWSCGIFKKRISKYQFLEVRKATLHSRLNTEIRKAV